MPSAACSKRPRRSATAPVNEPRVWPNSSESSSVSAIAPQLTATNGRDAAAAVRVDRARDQLLAGAALALDQHRDRRIRGARDLLVDLEHRRAAPEQPSGAIRDRGGGSVSPCAACASARSTVALISPMLNGLLT